ncbi:MAG: rod shape-determining protein MreC [Syntrophobacterales bacterium]|jgi:rod shape-determining protein MreC|nr:rod shape-determining protein MreC [Syntrophobacterales bacterium]
MRPVKRKKSFLVLAVLLVFVFVLLSYQLSFPQNPNLLRKVVLETSSVMESTVDHTIAVIKGTWSRYLFLHGLVDENKRLQEVNAGLARDVLAYEEARLENIRLRQLLAFKEQQKFSTVSARVIRRDLSGIMKTLMIDCGENDGIRKGQLAIVDAGVVGRVIETTWNAARILILTDENSNIDALIQTTRTYGILQGTGKDTCSLKHIVKTETVNQDDIILTSGLAGEGPKGLALGVVRRAEYDKTNMFFDIEVVPFVDFRKLEEVLVITGKWQGTS